MAYEKYIKRNGKIYGPYTYHSHRVNGKVVSEYRGTKQTKINNIKKNKKKIIYLVAILIIILISLWVLLFNTNLTGKSIVELNDYNLLLNNSGKLNIQLNHGELIPANSILTIENANNHYEFNLSSVLTEETNNGSFFLKENNINDYGIGYGEKGKKEISPTIFFKLLIKQQATSGGSNDGATPTENNTQSTTNKTVENATEPILEPTTNETATEPTVTETTEPTVTETTEPTVTETTTSTDTTTNEPTTTETTEPTPTTETTEPTEPTTTETTEPTTETTTEPTPTTEPAIESAPLTGNVINDIGGFFKNIFTGNVISEDITIQGDTTKDSPFKYSTNSNNIVSIIDSSIHTDEKTLNNSVLNIINDNGNIEVSTNYTETLFGFGSDYVTDEIKTYTIDLNSLNVHLESGDVIVNINYNGENLINFKKIITENITKDIVNESIPSNVNNNETTNKTINETVEKLFENITSTEINFTKAELTEEEKIILRNKFKLIVVNTTAQNYKDKVLVNFYIGGYSLSNSYSLNLNNETLNKLIENDRIIFLKDLANEFNKKSTQPQSRNDLNSLYPVI